MYKNEFQGGPYVELFSVQGKDPLSKLKLSGPHTCIKKEFNNDIRTFVLSLEGETSTTKILFPKSSKQSLHITQPYLVFQIYIHSGRNFSLEVSLTDQKNLKQRLILSSSNREVVVTALHVKMPCSIIETNVWLNLCLDLNDLLSSTEDKFSLLDSYTVSANCQLRRVFSLKNKPLSNADIPRNVFLGDVPTLLQLVDMNSFVEAGVNIRSGTGKRSSSSPRRRMSSDSGRHIAFGSKVLLRTDSTSKENLSSRSSNTARSTSNNVDINNNSTNDETLDENNNESLNRNEMNLVPRPPKQNQVRVRKPRIKSADYSKLKLKSEAINTQPLSKSADTRGRKKYLDQTMEQTLPSKSFRKSSIHTDSQTKPLPPVQFKKTLSKSAIDLETAKKLSREKSNSDSFRSKSLTILPKIGKPTVQVTSVELEEDSVFNSSLNNDDRPLTLGDDGMIEEYLRRRTTSSCTQDDSFSSSCATSTNSDLFLYSSRPKSVSCQPLLKSNGEPTNAEQINRTVDILHNLKDENNDIIEDCEVTNSSSGVSSNYLSKRTISTSNSEDNLLQNNLLNDDIIMDSIVPNGTSSPDFKNLSNSSHFDFSKDDEIVNDFIENEKTSEETNTTYDVENKSSPVLDNVDTLKDQINANIVLKNKKNILLPKKDSTLPVFHQYKPRDSIESDTMSWLNASVDPSESSKVDSLNVHQVGNIKPSPKLQLRQRLVEQLGSMIMQSKDVDTDDGFSDCSDDTTTADPPLRFHNYRYQDEIKSVEGSTIDLAATIPATPQVGEQASSNGKDDNNNGPASLKQTNNEELLDLLFDPVLNCYYDPKTEKYYELS